ncbi:hypothetical protein B0H66DRAFT_292956 [Apodospora peruviana]|uniref:Uncharacterized protein n=1 Tax=Apodospora peruviana TaxID=516989 RepID=A0AAE0M3B3_9PEZI|nr:hypothetical protein B0H66DRAFT_292956 [Apodospora peruviana]
MAIVGATPAVIAAFTFGILTNAASAALFLYCRGHGSAIFRDGQRLVLIIFLLSAALWAQIAFISVLLDVSTTSMPCQVATIFATIFDQLARFSIEQYMLWAMNTGSQVSAIQLIPQLLVLGRLIAGGVFVGFTRAQTDTFCVATSSVVPIAIVVIALDVVILLLLGVRAMTSGLVANMKKGPDSGRSKGLMFVMLGFAIWTATSVTMLLGMKTIDLAARTAVPASGLIVMIIIVTACVDTLITPRGIIGSRPPEAPSPRRMNISRDISSSDSEYPPTRFEDLKDATIRSSTTFVNPREVPRFKDETDVGLPTIARPITGISGMGGLPVQGELFPPPRAATVTPVVAVAGSGVARKVSTSSHKKGMFGGFGRSASSAGASGGKLVIGNPILQDNDAQNPLNKITVINLEEAAQAEKERRARLQRTSGLVANRPAPQPPSATPEEALKRAVSVKRKELASVYSQSSNFPVSLQPKSTAVSTSAQLSPAADEVRRRSPRQLEVPMMLEQQPALTSATGFPRPGSLHPQEANHALTTPPTQTTPPALPVQPAQSAQPTQPNQPAQPMPSLAIRPSRRLPSPKTTPPPEPTKTPLQRRPTIGLPSNPKARGLKVDQQASAQQQQTVLFMNNIVYNNPEAVQDIIKGASDRVKAPPAQDIAGSRRSVVNRPRPIPRKAADPQPSPSPSHRRSKSGGSFSRKSILTSTPGSPTQLPPLPDLPRSAGAAIRPQPNDTKSMTFDEKMTLLFPSPPSGNAVKRRSSVPDLPPIPISYLDTSMNSPSEPDDHRVSKRTTRTSVRTDSVFDVDEITEKMPCQHSPNVAEDVGNSWLPGIADERDDGKMRASQRSGRSTETGGKRASSPVIPAVPIRSSAWTESSDGRTHDDATTNWGSVHSPELAVGIPMPARNFTQPTTIQQTVGRPGFGAAKRMVSAPGAVERTKKATDSGKKPDPQESWLLEGETTSKPKPERASQWHHRVGDECPTFSARKEKTRSRKMPPPTPLLLNGFASNKKTLYVQAEPSPVESPEHVLQQIQAQLKKFEEPAARDSPNGPMQRLALLENLEKEMGLQEDHWQEMKHDLGRDSLSSIQTTSPGGRTSLSESVAAASVHVSRESSVKSTLAERRASRRAQMRTSGNFSRRTSTQSNDNAQLNNWQKRLTEAQMEYMDTAADMLRNRKSNLLAMPVSMAQLGSPTPPESDQSDDDMFDQSIAAVMNRRVQITSLWTPAPEKQCSPTKLLWKHVAKAAPEPEVKPPSLSVRPAPRKELAPLKINSRQLWRKPHGGIQRAEGGLWRPVWAHPAPPVDPALLSQGSSDSQSQKAPRPLTQRPPRRNKRMTLLPDILESPQPLPDKRGTLGIFQFPWGERSDTASIAPARPTMLMAMPGTMASGGPSMAIESRSKQLEAAEYSSSFFDDYDDDEENEERNSDDEEGDDSDDGFDETTLWEIASLLKSDNVPSKNSMFPPAHPAVSSSVISDYIDELPSDDEEQSSREQSIMIGLAEESREHFFKQSPPVAVESSTLWTIEDEPSHEHETKALQSKPSMIPRRVQEKAEPHATQQTVKPSQIPRFTGEVKKSTKSPKPVSVGLWQHPPARSEESSEQGMYSVSSNRSVYRTTTKKPAAVNMDRKPRAATLKPLDRLTSTSLWTVESVPKKHQIHWTGPKAHAVTKAIKAKTTKKLLRPVATAADWNAALNEAILVSYPFSTTARQIMTGPSAKKTITPSFDSATCHPVFAASSLVTKSEWFHPAATGYTFDVAIVNPIFFGSLAITCPLEAVHPAMSAYAAKKLRRQRSQRSGVRSSWRDRDRTPSRSDTQRMKRKEEIRAQIRALEQQQQQQQPISPSDDGQQQRFVDYDNEQDTMIQAQIEALEQERIFVQQAAQEEYKRRTSQGAMMFAEFQTQEPEPVVPALPRVGSIEDLQKHISKQVRQSLLLTTNTNVNNTSASSASPMTREEGLLWSPISSLATAFSSSSSPSKGTWSPTRVTIPAGAGGVAPQEDREAAARRERGRKQILKKARRNEIMAQITAIEAGVDIRAEHRAQGMWSKGGWENASLPRERDWLHEGKHRRGASRVELRY